MSPLPVLALLAPVGVKAQEVDFGRDVLPLLADRCFACHGPDAATRAAELRLDQRADALADRGDYAVIVPGDPDASELIYRITAETDAMPPGAEHERLSAEEVDVLVRWIEDGAHYDRHWAYTPPERPAVPATSNVDWPRTTVDAFVLARLDGAGRTPAPRADARTLARRLAFDLTGLPPTAEQVARLEADPSGAARDELIEELLSSAHHAERMATFWFDLVRFADTTGIHGDNRWNVHPYRDWVIEAFRANMPFDRFTREQLAGDLLPDATREQQIAAAYNRLNLITREGGSQPKEFLARYTADRVRNASEVWLATTLGCAECHDHKFDPLSARDFYSFGAFFADIEQVGVYAQNGPNNYLPELPVPSPEQEDELARLEAELARVEATLAADTPELRADRVAWEAHLREVRWVVPADLDVRADGDTELRVLRDGDVLAVGGAAETDTYRLTFALPDEPIAALRLELLPDASLPREGPGRSKNGNIVLSEVEVRVDGEPVPVAASRASYEQGGYPVAAAHDGERGKRGWAVMREGAGTPAEAVFDLGAPLPASAGRVEVVLHHDYGSQHALGRFRVSWSTRAGHEALGAELRGLLAEETATDDARLDELHRARTPLLAEARSRRAELAAAREATRAAIPLVLQTRAVEPMVTRVLARGSWMDESGAVVQPAVPAALGTLPDQARRPTRLDLANWLVDGRNPLVARVLVNRLWRMLLGRGLVRTLDDFGVQGALPTHPALLDHLAAELVDSGWDVRHVLRLIARSATYAQAAGVGSDDELFGSQGRFRLDAEFVRDNALAVSGLLVRDVGGPSVFPYQPPGYWAHLNFPKRKHAPSSGADLYRRALYGHWQRQYVHPSLLAFDAPSRERCTAERPRSNTPLAALALLNDPIFVEAARALAERTLRDTPSTDDERVDALWRRALQRSPRPEERELVLELVAEHRSHYAARPEAAAQLLSVGASPRDETVDLTEHAAWTSAARVVLNLHESIVRN